MTGLAEFYAELGLLDLPMPIRAALTECSTGAFMSLDLPTMAEAQTWAQFLGAGPLPVHLGKSTRFVYYYGDSKVTVGGFEIGLSAHEPIPADEAVAVKNLPGEGEEVAGPGAGSATAPTETPDVWVPIRRRGILYHQLDGRYGGDYTDCGRAVRPNGTRLPLAEATAFGAVPCPRCYGEQVAA